MVAKNAEEVEPMEPTMQKQVDELEAKLITRALKRHKGNLRQAAAYLACSRSGLYKKITRLEIDATEHRPEVE